MTCCCSGAESRRSVNERSITNNIAANCYLLRLWSIGPFGLSVRRARARSPNHIIGYDWEKTIINRCLFHRFNPQAQRQDQWMIFIYSGFFFGQTIEKKTMKFRREWARKMVEFHTMDSPKLIKPNRKNDDNKTTKYSCFRDVQNAVFSPSIFCIRTKSEPKFILFMKREKKKQK